MEGTDVDHQMRDVGAESVTKRQKISVMQDLVSPPLETSSPQSNVQNTITNGFTTSDRLLPLPSSNGIHMTSDLEGTLEMRAPTIMPKPTAEQIRVEHPDVDLTDLEETMADYQEALDEEEHEKLEPFKSFLPTGYCYDVRMRYHSELDPPKERRELHPEDPRRIFKIYHELCVAGLIENEQLNQGFVIPNPLVNIPVRAVTESEIELVHDKKMFDRMQKTRSMDPEELLTLEREHDSIYFNTTTFGCALLAAGGTINISRAVVSGYVKNAIAIVRPPGHHAECSRPMGFCIFDNVAIAAKVCQQDFSDCKKVLILDWDVHHGNGIQQAFYTDPSVLYISLHVHEDGNFYPSGNYGDHLHCGMDAGLGKNINIPWPTKGMGDADYMFAFQHVVMPVASEFDPDLVVIAAGFDAADGDQLGGCHVTPACYAHMTHQLMSLAKGKLVVCLEGGYNLRSISKSALAVTRTLVGETPDRLSTLRPSVSAIETVQKVAMEHSKFWPSLYPKDIPRAILEEVGTERMHDVVRFYQAAKLQETLNMINLNIYQEKFSKSLENQVMTTLDFEQEVPLLVILHDPPEIMEVPNPTTGKLELHNMWLADGIKHYMDMAVENGIAVIDANVPKFLSDADEDEGYTTDAPRKRLFDLEKLASYIWDNYIECNDATQVFFIGVGSAYQGIVHLLNTRTQTFTSTVSGIINFIDTTLVPASDQVVYDNPKWYRGRSLNFVSRDHLAWSIDQKKKSTKRYGNLIQSTKNGLNDMLAEHREEVWEWIGQRLNRVERGLGAGSGSGNGNGNGNGGAVVGIGGPVVAPAVTALSPATAAASPFTGLGGGLG